MQAKSATAAQAKICNGVAEICNKARKIRNSGQAGICNGGATCLSSLHSCESRNLFAGGGFIPSFNMAAKAGKLGELISRK
ncbi:MAG: hypothetical protein ACR2P5_09115 [Gammaproteobacteria bacterium]